MNIRTNNKINRKCIRKTFFLFILLLIFNQTNIFNIISLQNRLNLSIIFSGIYSDLFYIARDGKALKPIISKEKEKFYYFNREKKGVCLCTICKNENLYILEFVQYYQKIGYKKIIIFDNNDINGERFHKMLKDYISNNFVEIIDIRGLGKVQLAVYHYCYKKNNNLYDWISFFDIDEFLYIKKKININTYIYNKRFQQCQSVLFNWNICDDSNLERYDNRPLIERFKNCKKRAHFAKSMVRGNLENLFFPTSHICAINIKYFCDSNGNRIFPKSFINYNFNKTSYIAYIKHFFTKTAEEFCVKLNRGGGQSSKNKTLIYRLKTFLSINKITKNKIKILENCTKVNLTKLIKKIL